VSTGLLKPRVKVRDVASAFGVNCDTIRRWARKGKLPGARRIGKDWTFDPERINAALARR